MYTVWICLSKQVRRLKEQLWKWREGPLGSLYEGSSCQNGSWAWESEIWNQELLLCEIQFLMFARKQFDGLRNKIPHEINIELWRTKSHSPYYSFCCIFSTVITLWIIFHARYFSMPNWKGWFWHSLKPSMTRAQDTWRSISSYTTFLMHSGDSVDGHGQEGLLSSSPHVVELPTLGHLPGSVTTSI